jgi:glycosyltransferase involved in cell wall biosynthesis
VVDAPPAPVADAPGASRVLLASTLRAYEGAAVLIDAVALLRDGGVAAEPSILGSGPELDALRAKAAAFGMDPAAVLPGRVEPARVAVELARAAVVAVPRLDEAVCRWVVPLKPLEAMAAGRPLVISALPALEELGGDGRSRTVAPGDPHALADAIAADLGDPAGAQERADAARAWAEDHHGAPALDSALAAVLARVGLS